MKSNKRHSLSFRSIALLLAIISLCLVIFAGCTVKPSTDEIVIGNRNHYTDRYDGFLA